MLERNQKPQMTDARSSAILASGVLTSRVFRASLPFVIVSDTRGPLALLILAVLAALVVILQRKA